MILLLLLAPAIYATVNLVDKFLVHGEGDDAQTSSLLAIGGLFNLVLALPIGLWVYLSGESISLWDGIAILLNGSLYVGGMWIYFTVIREEGPSRVAPWFMAIPVIGLLGGILLLQEIPSLSQIISISLFVIGGLVLSMTDGKIRLRFVCLGLLMAILLSVHDVIFAKFGRELSGSAAVFMDMFGKSMWGLVLLFGKKTRNGFLIGLRTKLKFQMVNEMGVIAGDAITDVAKLMAPVALVQATGCSQSVFVLIGAYVLVRRFPDVFSEELKGSFLSKVIGVVLMTIGGIILAVTL